MTTRLQVSWYVRFIQLTAKFLTVVPLMWKDPTFLRIENNARRHFSKEWRKHVEAMASFAMAGHRRLGSSALASSMDTHVMDTILRIVYDSFFKVHPQFLRRGMKEAIDTSPLFDWAEKKKLFAWMQDDPRALAPYTQMA